MQIREWKQVASKACFRLERAHLVRGNALDGLPVFLWHRCRFWLGSGEEMAIKCILRALELGELWLLVSGNCRQRAAKGEGWYLSGGRRLTCRTCLSGVIRAA